MLGPARRVGPMKQQQRLASERFADGNCPSPTPWMVRVWHVDVAHRPKAIPAVDSIDSNVRS